MLQRRGLVNYKFNISSSQKFLLHSHHFWVRFSAIKIAFICFYILFLFIFCERCWYDMYVGCAMMCDASLSLWWWETVFVFLISSISGVHRVPMGKNFSAAAAFFVRPMKRNPFFLALRSASSFQFHFTSAREWDDLCASFNFLPSSRQASIHLNESQRESHHPSWKPAERCSKKGWNSNS